MPTKCCDACFARPAQGLEDVGTDFDKEKFTLPRADVCWCRSGEKPFAKHWCKKLFDLLANQDVDDFKTELERLRLRATTGARPTSSKRRRTTH